MVNYALPVIVAVIAVVAVLGWVSISNYFQEAAAAHITGSSEAKVNLSGSHCTATNPCKPVCGNHVCAPGEVPQPPK